MGSNETRKMILKTQSWKYTKVKEYLDTLGEQYEFEYVINVKDHLYYIYDLVLINRRVIIEFDGPDHNNKFQRYVDEEKNLLAEELGYAIERVIVKPNMIINPNSIKPILDKYSIL